MAIISKPKRVFIFGDTHFPFHDTKKLKKAMDLLESREWDYVIQIGDVLDLYSQSRFARSQDIMTPKEELIEGAACFTNFWEAVKKRAPKAKKIQMGGNHTDRLVKLACEKAPELLPYLDFERFFKVEGVQCFWDSKHELLIDDVIYCHGWLSSSMQHAKYFNKCVVHGHLHRGGVFMESVKDGVLWSLDVGYLADPMQVPLTYRATKSVKWVHGVGIVDELGPRFVFL